MFVLNCELFSRRQTGDSSCVHSYSSLFLCGRSVSVFSVTTHWDLKSPDGDSRDSTQHTSWLHFLLKPITLFQFTDALSDLSELFCCFWNLLVLFFRAVYEDDDDDDDDWRCILGLCVFCPNKSFWKHHRGSESLNLTPNVCFILNFILCFLSLTTRGWRSPRLHVLNQKLFVFYFRSIKIIWF